MIKITGNVHEANVFTHAGSFDAKDVFMALIISKAISNATICRTNTLPSILNSDVIVYNIKNSKSINCKKVFNGSCDLIWKKFGNTIIANKFNLVFVCNYIDHNLIQIIDSAYSTFISTFNPNWDSTSSYTDCFIRAVSFAEVIFNNVLEKAISNAKAKQIVEKSIMCSSGHIMILNQFVPWKNFLLSSEREEAEEILFVIYPSKDDNYIWQCVPESLISSIPRKSIPNNWVGCYDLQEITGIPNVISCYTTGLGGKAATLESAISLVKLAIKS